MCRAHHEATRRRPHHISNDHARDIWFVIKKHENSGSNLLPLKLLYHSFFSCPSYTCHLHYVHKTQAGGERERRRYSDFHRDSFHCVLCPVSVCYWVLHLFVTSLPSSPACLVRPPPATGSSPSKLAVVVLILKFIRQDHSLEWLDYKLRRVTKRITRPPSIQTKHHTNQQSPPLALNYWSKPQVVLYIRPTTHQTNAICFWQLCI